MDNDMKPHIDTPSCSEWKWTSDRLFEKYIGIQLVLYVALLYLAEICLSCSFKGLNAHQTLFFNFLTFLLFIPLVWFIPYLADFIIRKNWLWLGCTIAQYYTLQEIEEAKNDEERDYLILAARLNGRLPPSRKQQWALTIIVWILLFEVFYICAWARNSVLVWEPSWISDIIHWMKTHTYSSRDDELTSGIFDINLENTVLEGFFSNEKEFLQSPISDKLLLYIFFRMITYPVSIGCSYVAFSQAIDYFGLEKINPKNIDSVGAFLKYFLYYLPLILITFVMIMSFFWGAIEFAITAAINIHYWNQWVGQSVLSCIMIVMFFKFTSGWLIFIKRIYDNIVHLS